MSRYKLLRETRTLNKSLFYMPPTRKKVYKCKYCGKEFTSKAALWEHRKNNLFEVFAIRAREGGIRCGICKKVFSTYDAYKRHWDDYHDNHAYQLVLFGFHRSDLTKSNWRIRPLEYLNINFRIKDDATKRPLKYGVVASGALWRELIYGVKNRAMTVLLIVGIPEAGKSTLGITLGMHLTNMWAEKLSYKNRGPTPKNCIYEKNGVRLFVTFNYSQTRRVLKIAKPGDTIVQDENPNLSGEESRVTVQSIQNLLKIMRKKCINFIFCTPEDVTELRTVNGVIEVYAKDIERRITKAILYTRQRYAVGWLYARVTDRQDILDKYEQLKDENLERIQLQGGLEGVDIDEEAFADDIKTVLNKAKELHERGLVDLTRMTRGDALTIVRIAGIKGSSAYQESVARQVFNIVKSGGIILPKREKVQVAQVPAESSGQVQQEAPEKETKDDYIFTPCREPVEDIEILKDIYNSVSVALTHRAERGEKMPRLFKAVHAKAWFLRYYKGYSYDDVGAELGVSSQAISNTYKKNGWVAIFEAELLGECAEYAIWKRFFPDYQWLGGRHDPDLVSPDGKVVVEVKARRRLSASLSSFVNKAEREHLERGGEMILVLVRYDVGSCRVEFYRVELKKKKE